MNDKITKIDIITRPEMLDVQKGHKEIYRGRAYDINLLPKVKVETVVCEVPVEKVLNTAQEILCTGEHGDGKIFVYELANAVRIRTGQQGTAAIIDEK